MYLVFELSKTRKFSEHYLNVCRNTNCLDNVILSSTYCWLLHLLLLWVLQLYCNVGSHKKCKQNLYEVLWAAFYLQSEPVFILMIIYYLFFVMLCKLQQIIDVSVMGCYGLYIGTFVKFCHHGVIIGIHINGNQRCSTLRLAGVT